MRAETLRRQPLVPPSEIEWEELLVRLELMPRALRVLLEETDRDQPCVAMLLRDLIGREIFVRRFLERACNAGELWTETVSSPQMPRRHEDALDRFVRLRNRNFAMVQRRGIDVWRWEATTDGRNRATVYQVLSLLAREDVTALAAVRGFARSGASVC